jgi:hypothetical protein
MKYSDSFIGFNLDEMDNELLEFYEEFLKKLNCDLKIK